MELTATLRTRGQQATALFLSLWNESQQAKGLIVTILLGLSLILFGLVDAWVAPGPYGLPTERVEGVFADVNGDGRADYIVNAEVVLNEGPLASQP